MAALSRLELHRVSLTQQNDPDFLARIIEKYPILAYLSGMPATSPVIANEFIRRAGLHARHLTHMQLQKLVYIAHGWNLAINRTPLTTDVPQAWDYGPVYKDLYDALRRFGSGPVIGEIRARDFGLGIFMQDPARGDEPIRAPISDQERAVIDRVFSDYGKFHAYQLSALTHEPGTPWDEVYNHRGRLLPIDNALTQRHFIELASRPRHPA